MTNQIEAAVNAGKAFLVEIENGLQVLRIADKIYIDAITWRDADAPQDAIWEHATHTPESYLEMTA